jgi:uncharacterized protein
MVGKTGKIISFTVVRVPPAGFSDQAPYPVAVIEFDGGKRSTCQIVDCNYCAIQVGQKVKTIIRRITKPDTDGVIPYGIKAVII